MRCIVLELSTEIDPKITQSIKIPKIKLRVKINYILVPQSPLAMIHIITPIPIIYLLRPIILLDPIPTSLFSFNM
jgi:hypothetical protein